MALTTYNCVALTGGGVRALDTISVSNLSDGDRAICVVDGDFLYFMFDEDGTDAEDVTTHPYKVRPNDYSTGGVWIEQMLGTGDTGGSACLGSNKNRVINGTFEIWQRATLFEYMDNNTWLADRFLYNDSGTFHLAVTQSTDVPTVAQAGIKATSSLKIYCQTADTILSVGDKAIISQKIEGYNIRDLMGKSCTLSFWVKSNYTGTYSVALRSGSVDYSYVSEYTISSSNTWEKKTITFTMADGSTGTWNYTTGIGLYLSFTLLCGTTNQTSTLDQWQSADKIASSNQVNLAYSTSNEFFIALVQLELGEEATDFENRTFKEEIALCQRYYEKSSGSWMLQGYVTSTSFYSIMVAFSQRKRAAPTVTTTIVGVSNFSNTDPAVYYQGEGSFRAALSCSGTGSGYFTFTWVADAEM